MNPFKNSILRYFLLLFCVYSPHVFAAVLEVSRGTSDSGTQRDLTSDQIDAIKQLLYNQTLKDYSVNLYGLLQGNFNFVDTIRNNTPDFNVAHARLGVLAVEKNWSGKFEVEFYGNQPQVLAPAAPPNTPLYLRQSANNTVYVRQAQINFDFLNLTSAAHGKSGITNKTGMPVESVLTDTPQPDTSAQPNTTTSQSDDAAQAKNNIAQTTSSESQPKVESKPEAESKPEVNTYISRISIGGIRPGGAAATSPDAANSPSGFSRMDGVYVTENMVFAKTDTVNLGFGLFNTLFATNSGPLGSYQGWGEFPGTTTNFLGILGVTSSTFSKAFLFNAGYTRQFGESKNLNVSGFYGFQNGSAVNVNQNGFATTTRNATHIEVSALYNDSKLFGDNAISTGNGISFYFEDEIGSDQRNTGAAVAPITAPTQDGYNNTLYGISIGGDTENYLTGIIKDADRFLYSAGINLVNAKFSHFSYSPNYEVYQYAASLGYGYKTLEASLVGAYSHSPQNTMTVFDYNAPMTEIKKTKDVFIAYVMAAIYF